MRLDKKLLKIIVSALTIFLVLGSAALLYLNFKDKIFKSQIIDSKFLESEEKLAQEIKLSNKNSRKAIVNLEKIKDLPSKLENRRKYILAKLYQKIDEPALAFMRAYEIEGDYIPQYSGQLKIDLAQKIGLESIVLKELQILNKKYPKEAQYSYELAKCYLRQNMKEEAQKAFLAVQKNFPKSEYALGSDYYLANLSQDPVEKKKYLQNYLKSSPGGSLAYLIVDQITASADKKEFAPLVNHIAISYFHQKQYAKAIEIFDPSIDSPDLYINEISESYIALGKKEEAKKLIISALPHLNDAEVANKAIDSLLKLTSNDEFMVSIESIKDQIPSGFRDRILWELAVVSDAKEDFAKVYELYPESLYAAESLAKVFWKEYQRENYHRAIELFKQHWNKYDFAKSHSFVAFWAGKIYLKQEEINSAKEVFNNLIISHPHSYYSFRAQQILDKKDKWYLLPGANEFSSFPQWNLPDTYKDEAIAKDFGEDILELTKLQDYKFIINLENKLKLDEKFKLWLYAKDSNYLKMIEIARTILKEEDQINYEKSEFQFAYPLPYSDLIADETGKNLKIDPMLAHALILQESHYQKDIVSPVGAVGLMQLMPYTAKSLAKELEIKPPRTYDLMQADINIKLGVKYMEEVFGKFSNNMINSIASYNAGPAAVSGWQTKYATIKDVDEYVENIPYDETRNYVKHVLENYWIYKKLYS
ncbi:MAG: transglycosylase SLT domain-containing protein [Candidatus Caenarcaniphilales bacterium]|nr:transglycosylase SLT domain-containing protein [Candidatus Caenarcaniphilales bacterium]